MNTSLFAMFHHTKQTPGLSLLHHLSTGWRLSFLENAVAKTFHSCFKSKLKNNNASTRSPLSSFLLPIAQRLIDWLIDWSANQDASTTFYPEARWGTRLCSIHTDATMLPPPPLPPSPLYAHLPITHSPPRSTPTQAWALDRFTSVSTNPSVSRHYKNYWQSRLGGFVRASCFLVLVYFFLAWVIWRRLEMWMRQAHSLAILISKYLLFT